MKLSSAAFYAMAATFAFETAAFSPVQTHAAARQTSLFAIANNQGIVGKEEKPEEERSVKSPILMKFAEAEIVANKVVEKVSEKVAKTMFAEKVVEKVVEKVAEKVVKATPDPMKKIFKQNAAWVESKTISDPEYFKKLGSGHKPNYLWIGCADARVPCNVVMGEDAGSVFVLRNVANMVVNTDFNLMAGLQYAVNYLKIPDIIVCGHYDCGGVRASTATNDHAAPLENWLRNIRDVYRLHRAELDDIKDSEARHRRLVELNVIEQCVNLHKTGAVQRSRLEAKTDPANASLPRIHPCVFDPKNGRLVDLQVDLDDYMLELKSIYGLYDTEALAL